MNLEGAEPLTFRLRDGNQFPKLVAFIPSPKVAPPMKAFRAIGAFRAGKRYQPFTIDLIAEDEQGATERLLSNLGSRHRVTRRFVKIDTLAEINPSESTSPVVVAHFRDQ